MGSNLSRFFSQMGARVKVANMLPVAQRWSLRRNQEEAPQITIDIGCGGDEKFFEIRAAPGSTQEIVVLNVQPREKHLVLLSRQFDVRGQVRVKQKFSCGRDEKHWFAAAIPENEPVGSVASAKAALKPEAVRARERAVGVSQEESFRRKNVNYVRQGEWFFLPSREFIADPLLILRIEPLVAMEARHMWPSHATAPEERMFTSRRNTQRGFLPRSTSACRKANASKAANHATRRGGLCAGSDQPPGPQDHRAGWMVRDTKSRSKAMSFVAFLD